MKAAKINCYYDGRLQPPAFKQAEVTLDSKYGTGYLHPNTRVYTFVLKDMPNQSRLTSLKILEIVEVAMGVNVDFATFFNENNVDPVTISPEFKSLIPPDYEENYNPEKLVRQDPFIRNMAAVLQINPDRIRVVNIVPGNSRRRRMRLLMAMGYSVDEAAEKEEDYYLLTGDRRFLVGDEGLDLNFEIAETDPCADLDCGIQGICKAGKCECNDGFYSVGAYRYNTTVDGVNITVNVNASQPCAVNQTQWTKIFNSTSSGDGGIALDEEETIIEVIEVVGNTTNTTASAEPINTFAELVSVATSLSENAEQGTLDLGYEVSAMVVVVPPDVCGVPGGDGTSCNDKCGIPLGDNSTCTDICGILFGDGTSCLVEETAYYDCSIYERQEVKIVGNLTNKYMSGLYTLSFNGETTEELSVLASAEEIQAAITSMVSVGAVRVEPLVYNAITEYTTSNTSADGFSGAYSVNFGVEFKAEKTIGEVRNYGSLPLLEVSVDNLVNGGNATVNRTCGAVTQGGYTLEEQFVTVTSSGGGGTLADMTGGFRLGFDMSSQKPFNVSAYTADFGVGWSGIVDIQELLALEGGGTDYMALKLTEVGDSDLELNIDVSTVEFFLESAEVDEVAFRVRFNELESSEWLKLADSGGDLPLMVIEELNLAGGSVTVGELVDGIVPNGIVPVNEIVLANKAAEAAATAAAAVAAAAQEAADLKAAAVVIKPVVYVCGDGVKGTAESCDDGNMEDGDGCSANCAVESGWVCTSVVNQQSSCSIPVDPTFAFESVNFGPYLEGEMATVKVLRLGDDDTEVSVDWQTSDASAMAELAKNSGSGANTLQTAGDYVAGSGTLTFGVGETEKTIDVQILEDNNWDGAINEQVAVVLENPVGAEIVTEFGIAYISIVDEDSWASFSPTASPTESPTSRPTGSPTESPTMAPTVSPTPSHCVNGIIDVGESDTDCGITCGGNCEVGSVCNEDGDCSLGWCVEGECVAAPTAAPTESPTFSPTTTPTIEPTAIGSLMTVLVKTSLSGITVEEFSGPMIEKFEKDMAEYYGVDEEYVLVTKVSAKGEDRRRRLSGGGVEVDYVIVTEDRAAAEDVAVLVKSSAEVVKAKVTEAASVILQKVINVTVENREVELEAQTEEEWELTLVAVEELKGQGDEEGGGIELLIIIAVVVILGLSVILYLVRLRRELKKRNTINIATEKRKKQEKESLEQLEMEKQQREKAEEDERQRKKQVEDAVRRQQEQTMKELEEKKRIEKENDRLKLEREAENQRAINAAKKEEFQASIQLKPRYAQLGESSTNVTGDNNLEKWLAKKHIELDMDDDDDDDDEILADLLLGETPKKIATMPGPPIIPASQHKGLESED